MARVMVPGVRVMELPRMTRATTPGWREVKRTMVGARRGLGLRTTPAT